MKVTFLGTGTSRGIPVIGCECPVCLSENPKNKRLRSSVLIEGNCVVVIDTSVDFRQQMLTHRVKRLDAVVYTHSHADHLLGLDDVYPFNIWGGAALPVFAEAATVEAIRATFRYLFEGERYPGIPELELHPIQGPFRVGDLQFEPIRVFHGTLPILGFRVGSFAYLTDVSRIPAESIHLLQDLDVLVLDGLRYRRHPTHFSVDEAVRAAAELDPAHTYLIHMCHDIDHEECSARLPETVHLAFDGLVLEIDEREPARNGDSLQGST